MNITRRALAVAGVSLSTAAVAITVAAGPARAVTITGSGTSITFSGSGGDFVTGDQPWSFDPTNSIIDASVTPDGNHVAIGVNGSTSWQLDFAAPQGQELTAGTVYDNAARYPFQSALQPGLSLFGDGRGCNTVTGSFTVKSVIFGSHGWIQDFDATFVQHCEGDPNSAATGEVILENGPAPADLTVTVVPAASVQVSHVSGNVMLTGTVTCNRTVTVSMGGSLRQRLSRTKLASGNWSVGNVPCGTTPTSWSATVVPNGIPFGEGKAEVDGTFDSFDPVFQVDVNGSFSQVVKLAHG
jgi:hypothetical protein